MKNMDGSKKKVRFAYYDQVLTAEIAEDNLVKTAFAPPAAPLDDPAGGLFRALSAPVGAPPLTELLQGREGILIAVPDHTRRTDLAPVLAALLTVLAEEGYGPDRVIIAVAGGTHKPMSDAELRKQWGPDITGRYRFLRHRWNEPGELISRGRSPLGIPLQFNRVLFEERLHIGLGTVKPHPVAGWSGGAKIILPGLAGKDSTDYFHWTAASYPVETIFGQENNPMRLEIEEAVGMVGLHLIINVIENKQGQICGLAAGDFVQAHRFLVEQSRSVPLLDLPMEQPDAMIVGGGTDRPELWEAAAGLYVANILLREEGTLVLAAACPDGVAKEHPAVLEWGYRPYSEVAALVAQGKIVDLTAASHLALVGDIIARKKFRVILVSAGIGAPEAERLGLDYADSLDGALSKIMERHGSQAKIFTCERI